MTERYFPYIDVLGFRDLVRSGFDVSELYRHASEIAFDERNAETFSLYRVYEYESESRSGKVYILQGPVSGRVDLSATQYRARLK